MVLAFLFIRPPRSDGDRSRFGDRDGYRGGPRGGDEKGGAPADFQPSFQVNVPLTITPSLLSLEASYKVF